MLAGVDVEGSPREDRNFGDWFTMRRKQRGTQAKIARELGTTKEAVRSWERGTLPDPALGRQIAWALGVPEAEVVREIERALLEPRRPDPEGR